MHNSNISKILGKLYHLNLVLSWNKMWELWLQRNSPTGAEHSAVSGH
jgi:hypothetical protein